MSNIGNRRSNTLTGSAVKQDMAQRRHGAQDKARQKRLDHKVFDAVQAPELAWKRKR